MMKMLEPITPDKNKSGNYHQNDRENQDIDPHKWVVHHGQINVHAEKAGN
jgi:hypothetical protein